MSSSRGVSGDIFHGGRYGVEEQIEKSLNTIIEKFEEMKHDLLFLLSEDEDPQN